MAKRLTVALLISALFSFCGVVEAAEISEYQTGFIKAECEKYGLSYTLVCGVIQAESSFDINADSGSSKGIMQLNKNTYPGLAEDLGIKNFDVFDFENNVQAGVYHLNNMRVYWQEQGYCDEDVFVLMLISYNRGLNGCKKYIDRNGIVDDDYVRKVWDYKIQLESERIP